MRKRLATVLCASVLAIACGQTDAGITTAVKTKFAADDMVQAHDINVDTSNHVVTLTGTVGSAAAHERALTITRGTDGVQNVVDQLTVTETHTLADHAAEGVQNLESSAKTGAEKAGEATKEGAEKVGEATKEGAEKVGDVAKAGAAKTGELAKESAHAVGSAGRRAGEVITDSAITAAVKTKLLADSSVSGLKIEVDTTDGVVTLAGNVKSAAEAAQATKLARGTDGVHQVVNHLHVGK